MKYANYIILFILLLTAFAFKNYIHISTNLLSLFAPKQLITKLNIVDKLGYSKEMLIAVKGFNQNSKIKVGEISKQLDKINGILLVQSTIIPSKSIQKYFRQHYALLAHFNDKPQSQKKIKDTLQKLYKAQIHSIFYTAVSSTDPLGLFHLRLNKKINIPHSGIYIKLGKYGYLIRVKTDVSASQMQKAKILYKKVYKVLDKYKGVVAFAPFFYTVQNSAAMQTNIKWIVSLSTIVLLLIYVLLIRNIKLLSNTLITLFSSMLFATLISMLVFKNFNILALVFGMSITSVAVDYILHYYFHNFYYKNKIMDKNVLYGFLTTVAAFGIFSFIPIPIISQISFFAVLSLTFAYLVFTFVYPYINIKRYVTHNKKRFILNNKIPTYIFTLLSAILFIYSYNHLKIDTNLRDLDYQNIKLKQIEQFFKQSNINHYHPVLVQADTQNQLIQNLHILQNSLPTTFSLATFVLDKKSCLKRVQQLKNYNFTKIHNIINQEAQKIGFKKDYFKNTYNFVKNIPTCDVKHLNIFKTYNLSIYKKDNRYYTMAFVKNINQIQHYKFISNININKMFKKIAKEMFKNLIIFSFAVLFIILILVMISVKKRFLYAINYIIFPTSLVLAFLTTFYSINIIHIFSLIILIAIGIDFGIYMSNTKKEKDTMLAITYSLLSTFAGFGVLIFSSITVLNSIGIVISLGILTIFIMMKIMK